MTAISAPHPVDDCVEAARGAAKLTRQAYRAIVPVGEGLTEAIDRVGPVSPMRPASPLLEAVATLSVANSAGQRALELMLPRSEAAQVAEVATALYETARSGRLSVLALTAGNDRHAGLQLAHAAGYACHLIAEAMVMYDELPVRSSQSSHRILSRTPFPRAWHSLITELGTWLVQHGNDDPYMDGGRTAVAAAYGGAEHIARAYDGLTPINGAVGALRRYARISALAAAFCGWAAVDVEEVRVAEASHVADAL